MLCCAVLFCGILLLCCRYEKIGTPDARAIYDDFGEDPGGFDTYADFKASGTPARLSARPPASEQTSQPASLPAWLCVTTSYHSPTNVL